MIVRRTANSTHTINDFYAGLGATIPDQADRADFFAGAPVDLSQAVDESTDEAGSSSVAPSFDEALLSKATRHLAEHIGPLARVFVRKAAEVVRDRDGLYARLAEHIPKNDDRKRFLATAAKDTD